MAASRPLSDQLRAVPAPAALVLIAGASFVGVPFVAGMFGAGATRAEVMPSNATGRVRTGAGGLPASMPTYMPSLTGSASPATYAAPQAVASMGYAAGIGDGASSAGTGGGGGSGGSSNARQHQSKTADQTRTAPADRPRSHLASRGGGLQSDLSPRPAVGGPPDDADARRAGKASAKRSTGLSKA